MHGRKLNGKRIKVEPITDFKGQNRVRVPGKIVAYVLGYVPKEDDQFSNESRTSANFIDNNSNKRYPTGNNSGSNKAKKKNSKRNGGGGRQPMFERLSEPDQRAFERASRQGFVTLEGTGYRRGRKSSPLANLHREWCDKRSIPQIVLCKASGGRPLDNVIVDLSPLRLGILSPDVMDAAILKYQKQIIKAAEASGMMLRSDYVEDNSEKVAIVEVEEQTGMAEVLIGVPTFDSSAWAKKPISSLPTVSMGVFEGERVCAKRITDCLVREVKEETGVDVDRETVNPFCLWESCYPTCGKECLEAGSGITAHYLVVFCTAQTTEKNLSKLQEQVHIDEQETDMAVWLSAKEFVRSLEYPLGGGADNVIGFIPGIVPPSSFKGDTDGPVCNLNLDDLCGIYPRGDDTSRMKGIAQGNLFMLQELLNSHGGTAFQ